MNKDKYIKFITRFIDKGYAFKSFFDYEKKGSIILRHDIDYDVDRALEIAIVENSLGIKSTFFFLMRSYSYNFLSPEVYETVLKIKDLGHTVSIHFDPTVYEDYKVGLMEEVLLFKSICQIDVKIISLHRPSEAFLNYNGKICNISHTYQEKYFKDLKYFSDSGGRFKYGSPFDSKEFSSLESIQLLIHPIWWYDNFENINEVFERLIVDRCDKFRSHVYKNCKTFRKS